MSSLEQGLVISQQQLAGDLFELEFLAPKMAASCQPGQFLHVKTSAQHDPLLRRPISIYDVDKDAGTITLLYKVVGRGTQLMTGLKAKDSLDVMGPLGKSFSLPDHPQKVLLVGGGVGIAPLMYLARRLKDMQCSVKVLYGTASSVELVASERFRKLGVELETATMDGTAGHQGLVTELLQQQSADALDLIYTCGPEIMMAAVADFASVHNIWGECSLEEHMACGVGACLGCARKLKLEDDAYVKVCKDGPVFNIQLVELNVGEVMV